MFIKDATGCLLNTKFIKKIYYNRRYSDKNNYCIFATMGDTQICLKNDLCKRDVENELFKIENMLNTQIVEAYVTDMLNT